MAIAKIIAALEVNYVKEAWMGRFSCTEYFAQKREEWKICTAFVPRYSISLLSLFQQNQKRETLCCCVGERPVIDFPFSPFRFISANSVLFFQTCEGNVTRFHFLLCCFFFAVSSRTFFFALLCINIYVRRVRLLETTTTEKWTKPIRSLIGQCAFRYLSAEHLELYG